MLVKGRNTGRMEGAALANRDTRAFGKNQDRAVIGFRLFGHPQPVVMACPGHAVAAGAFIVLASDTRIGVSGKFKYALPETAIGMTLPPILHELAAARLSKRHLTQVLIQALPYTPERAIDAGFLDEVVAPEALIERAMEVANQLAQLPGDTYGKNKRDARAASLARMEESVAAVKASLPG